jgi:DNA-directed RNA polymerase specialized sigma24 family protein
MSVSPARAHLDPGSWDDLFDFLDPARPGKAGSDRDALAEARCIEIRRKLACFFSARGCPDADDLAIDTLLRVAGKCGLVDRRGFADCTGYFYGVARNVLHEWQHRASAEVEGRESLRTEFERLPVPDASAWAETEFVHRCLASCLSALGEQARRLLLSYYSESGAAKIDHHRALAGGAGKSVNSLRIEVHRIRKAVRECLFDRLRNASWSPDGTGASAD